MFNLFKTLLNKFSEEAIEAFTMPDIESWRILFIQSTGYKNLVQCVQDLSNYCFACNETIIIMGFYRMILIFHFEKNLILDALLFQQPKNLYKDNIIQVHFGTSR